MPAPIAATVLALVLASEYLLGGIARMSALPLPSLNDRVFRKTVETAPHLAPVIPFADVRHPRTVRLHMLVVGALMALEGALLALPATRGSRVALGLGSFLTAAGAWSQMRAGMPFWLPVVNFVLGWSVWWLH